jgi:hypothetical protein
MGRRHLYFLAALLAAVGAALFLYKWLVLEFPVIPGEQSAIWRVETRLQFVAAGGPVKVTLHIPPNGTEYTIVSQNFVAPGFGYTTATDRGNRTVTFSLARASGEHVVYYRAVVHRARSAGRPREAGAEPQVLPTRYRGNDLAAARAIVRAALRQAADNDTLVKLIFARLRNPRPDGEAAMLLGLDPSMRRISDVGVQLLRLAGVAARTVHGLALAPDRRNARFDRWVEFHGTGGWRTYDPRADGFAAPALTLPWWRGAQPLVTVEGGGETHTDVAVRQAFEFTLRAAIARTRLIERALIEFSTLGLPLQTQAVYQILLVVPVGIFLLVVLRNVIGVKTFGTFMPVLIAMAFRQTELLWGLVLFSIVLACGLAIRFYLEQLKLLLVPRLACVVIVVILIMSLLSMLSHKLGLERGLSVALFPIVILSMTIERMTIVWDERGPKEAFTQAFGSLTVAVLCYLVMNVATVKHLAFVFPETLLIVLAATLLLGRYAGYRLVELPRFRVLAGGGK